MLQTLDLLCEPILNLFCLFQDFASLLQTSYLIQELLVFLRLNRFGFLLVEKVNRIWCYNFFVMLDDVSFDHLFLHAFVLLFEDLPLMFRPSLSDLVRSLHSLVDQHYLSHADRRDTVFADLSGTLLEGAVEVLLL